jgi:hypothetical protein
LVAPVAFLITPRQGPSRKHRFQQYLCYCMRIHCCGNVFTEPLPRNDSGIFAYLAVVLRATLCAGTSAVYNPSTVPQYNLQNINFTILELNQLTFNYITYILREVGLLSWYSDIPLPGRSGLDFQQGEI